MAIAMNTARGDAYVPKVSAKTVKKGDKFSGQVVEDGQVVMENDFQYEDQAQSWSKAWAQRMRQEHQKEIKMFGHVAGRKDSAPATLDSALRLADEFYSRADGMARGDAGDARVIYNKLLGGWYVVRGPHQTPLSGKYSSKEEAKAFLERKR